MPCHRLRAPLPCVSGLAQALPPSPIVAAAR